jgi:hypothetical protein
MEKSARLVVLEVVEQNSKYAGFCPRCGGRPGDLKARLRTIQRSEEEIKIIRVIRRLRRLLLSLIFV